MYQHPFAKKMLLMLRYLCPWLFARFSRHKALNKNVVPDNFDWEFYLDFHSDLRHAGLKTRQDAIEHYTRHGFYEKRIIRPHDKTLIDKHEKTRLRQLENIRHYEDRHHRIIKNDAHGRRVTISVVITLYNYAEYIETCLQSVLDSTFKEIEIIIVNDCSTDDSLSRCRAVLSCTLPVTIIDKKINTGLSHSRNLGIRLAEGDYVFILDADNRIYPDCLEEHLARIRRDNAVACYAVIDMFDETGMFCGQNSDSPFDFEKLYSGNYIDAMALFNRRELISMGTYDERLLERGIGYEDYELWLRIGQQKKPVSFIERSLSRYLQKQGSMLSIADQYYNRAIMSFLRNKYFIEKPYSKKTAILITGMHRSGTSALAGLIAGMGVDPGTDLIGPRPSNPKGHFEPRKIIQANNTLLKKLGATGAHGLPEDWMAHAETRKVRAEIKRIITDEFDGKTLFMIKDPRLCLLLPLYREVFEELSITVKVIVIRRNQEEIIRSLARRDGTLADTARAYCEKHIRALEVNLAGMQYTAVRFEHLIETPEAVISKIMAYVPQLAFSQNPDLIQKAARFIEPGLRHHNLNRKNILVSIPAAFAHILKKINTTSSGPDFLIIGAQRAGTSSLFHYLCLHPQILRPAAKELHWFHAGPEDGYHNGHRSQQWYEKQLHGEKKTFGLFPPRLTKLVFEATPEYLYHPTIAEQVARLYPATKIIVLLRDPLERAISQYYHEKKHGFIESDLSIDDYLSRDKAIAAAEEPKLASDPDYYSYAYEHHCPISRSNYGRQLDRWLRVFPRKQVLILRSEEMFCDPYPALNTVCTFLNIQPFPAGLDSKLTAYNVRKREHIHDEHRKKLAAYFHFDLSIEKFCTPS